MSAIVNCDWKAAKAEYVSSLAATYASIAAKFGVKERTLRYHASRNNWVDDRLDYQLKAAAKLTAAVTISGNAINQLRACNDRQMKLNDELRFILQSKLKVRGADGKTVVRPEVTITEVAKAIAAFTELYRVDRLALGASTDNIQPVSSDRFAEMSDDELEAELVRVRAMPATVN